MSGDMTLLERVQAAAKRLDQVGPSGEPPSYRDGVLADLCEAVSALMAEKE